MSHRRSTTAPASSVANSVTGATGATLACLSAFLLASRAVQAYEPCASIRSYWACFQEEDCIWHPIKGQCAHLCQGRTEKQCLEPAAGVCMWIPFHQLGSGGVCTNVERTVASKINPVVEMANEVEENKNTKAPLGAENEVSEAMESSPPSPPGDVVEGGEVVEILPLEPPAEEIVEIFPKGTPVKEMQVGETLLEKNTDRDDDVERESGEKFIMKELIRVDEMASKDELLQFHGMDDGTLLCPSESPDEPTTALKIASMWNGLLTVMIDWGDGTLKERHRSSVGAFSSTNFDHAYTKSGMYAITASATVRRMKDESGESEIISNEYLTHIGVREACKNNAFFGSVSLNCEAIPSETSDQFYLAKVCFGPQKDQILDYSIDWGPAPLDIFIGRVFEMGQMVCHSRLYKERGRHIFQVQVENSDGTAGSTESSDIILRQKISLSSTSCSIADYEPHLRRLRSSA